MPTEIEAKFRVNNHAEIRARLTALSATNHGLTHETNTFFDTPTATLRSSDQGLRIRVNRRTTGQSLVVTYKGPKRPGQYKSREEIELEVNDHDALVSLFSRLGYQVTLSFDKKRETWNLGEAEIVLDTLPYLGDFFEVEAPNESTIQKTLASLNLSNATPVKESYIQLIAQWAESHSPGQTVIKF